jgi:hypothetical protein
VTKKPFSGSAFLGGLVLLAVISVPLAYADKARVLKATATANVGGSYSFSATIAYADTGWNHYADKFEILAPDGKVLGTRILYHPHVDEQPFTRGSGNIQIPAGIEEVIVRASDNVHKAGKVTFTVKLPPRR